MAKHDYNVMAFKECPRCKEYKNLKFIISNIVKEVLSGK